MNRREALKQSALMMGYGVSAAFFSSLVSGCKVDTSEDWTPQFFTKQQADDFAELAEHILPRTDTPGAKDVLVHRVTDKIIAECYSEEAKQNLKKELAVMEAKCQSMFQKSFAECTPEQKDAFLKQAEVEETRPPFYIWGNLVDEGVTPFYRQLKGMILFAYFTSEAVGTNVLPYDPIPGKFVGCVEG